MKAVSAEFTLPGHFWQKMWSFLPLVLALFCWAAADNPFATTQRETSRLLCDAQERLQVR